MLDKRCLIWWFRFTVMWRQVVPFSSFNLDEIFKFRQKYSPKNLSLYVGNKLVADSKNFYYWLLPPSSPSNAPCIVKLILNNSKKRQGEGQARGGGEGAVIWKKAEKRLLLSILWFFTTLAYIVFTDGYSVHTHCTNDAASLLLKVG